jgi:hypothetical protein
MLYNKLSKKLRLVVDSAALRIGLADTVTEILHSDQGVRKDFICPTNWLHKR